MIDKPPSLTDREVLSNENYFFVSYAHKNSDTVFPILSELFNSGVNYWYDKELDVGDVWTEEAKNALISDKCRGAIVFVSVESAASDAVYNEVKIIKDIYKENPHFRIVLVLLGFDSILDWLSQAIQQNKGVSEIKNKSDAIYELSEDQNRIFCPHTDLRETCDLIIKQSELVGTNTKNAVIMNNKDITALLASEHKLRLENTAYYIEMGKYSLTVENELDPITWKLVGHDRSEYYFITDKAIDFVDFSRLSIIERDIFDQIKHYPHVTKVYTMDAEFCKRFGNNIGKHVATDYADTKRAQFLRAFWIKNPDDSKKPFLICSSSGEILNRVIVPDNINCGVRLVAVIDSTKVKE